MPVSPSFTSPFGGLIQGILGPTANQRNLMFDQEKIGFGQQKENAANAATAAVTKRAGELLASGVPPASLYFKILSDPIFLNAFTEGADPNVLVKGISDTILSYQTPKVLPNLGPGDAPGTQLPGQPPVYGTPNPTTDMQNARAGLGGTGGDKTAEERGLAALVANGTIPQQYMDKYRANQIQVQPKRDQYNQQTIGYDIIDILDGKLLKTISNSPEAALAFGGGATNPSGAPAGAQGGQPGAGGAQGGAQGPNAFPTQRTAMEPYRRGIRSVESGSPEGNYREVGPLVKGDRAYGAYQVMGANIGPWTKEVLGQAMTPREFLDSQQAQDAVFDAKFGSFLKQTGNPNDAASMWFSGRPMAQAGNSSDGYTTVPEYVKKFNAGMGQGGDQPIPLNPQRQGSQLASNQQPAAAGGAGGPALGTPPPGGAQPTAGWAPIDTVLGDPTDMFLGAGTFPALGEFASGVASGITGSGGVGDNELTARRQALSNYRFALGELSDSARILKADRENLAALGPNMSPLNIAGNPRDEVTHALQVLELLGSLEQSARADIDSRSTSPEVKAQAARDISAISRVRSSIPDRVALKNKLTQLESGGGKQYGPFEFVDTLKGLFSSGEKTLENKGAAEAAKGTPAPEAPGAKDRSSAINGFKSFPEIMNWINTASPPPTAAEMATVKAKIDALGK